MGTANATDYIVSGDAAITKNGHNWFHVDNDNIITETTQSGIYTLVVENCSLNAGSNYGFKIKKSQDGWDGSFPGDNYIINVPYTGTYTIIYYVDIANSGIRVIAQPELRWNLGNNGAGNWDWLIDDASKFTKDGDFGWTFEILPTSFTSDFSFRIYSGVFKKQAYPNSQDLAMSYGSGASTSAYFNSDNTQDSWRLTKPGYTFEKVIISAVYNPFADAFGTWNVSADAYVKVTTNASGYSTLTLDAPLTISGATAYYATDNGNGSATAHAITNPAANTPMLIKGTASTSYTFAVAASGTDYSSSNAFKAGEGSTLASMTAGKYNYILNGDKFMAANDKMVGTDKAYLQLSKAALARVLTIPGEEETGINVITNTVDNTNAAYNLSGQRVASPSKGLYIVNGRKVIMK